MKELKRELIKIDKNGSKHFNVTYVCPDCHGTGNKPWFQHVDFGVCYCCNGSGQVTYKEIERTPEYQSKLDARRAAREAARAAAFQAENEQALKELLPENKVYFVLGDTYGIKEEIKSHNGKYDPCNGWYFTTAADAEGFEVLPLTVEEAKIEVRRPTKKTFEISFADFIEKPDPHPSEYFGSVGEKIDIEVEYETQFSYDSRFGSVYIIKFKHGDDVLVWKTNKAFFASEKDQRENKKYKIALKGTIKEHSEYNGEKQTVLTRCKIKGINCTVSMGGFWD